ncbi:hypothetical protein JFL43_07750 [Viridibacillus sp. YIM B01967]|uniref:Uncharacterized protein n=1 Tax=Viridibacillus soli TaxID=2798301 RepID=A0ABS1H636_9BACL|nr:hypothetical protein [Viridibacillus soli]MBK3494751.1 hypothetical protein [Viridibacillus soli]
MKYYYQGEEIMDFSAITVHIIEADRDERRMVYLVRTTYEFPVIFIVDDTMNTDSTFDMETTETRLQRRDLHTHMKEWRGFTTHHHFITRRR